MKVCFITGFTPWPENRKGISGHIYYLIKSHSSDIKIDIFSYNMNKFSQSDIDLMAKDLDCNINVIPPCKRNRFILGNSIFRRIISWTYLYPIDSLISVTQNIKKRIAAGEYDVIWLYPNFYYRLAKEFPNQRFVISGPDCESLNATRRFADPYYIARYVKRFHNFVYFNQVVRREHEMVRPNVLMHLVGMSDYNYYCMLHHTKNAFFILHPHYSVTPKQISFNHDKLQVIISGNYDYYMITDSDIMTDGLIEKSEMLKDKIEITFLGKGWENISSRLSKNGYVSRHIKWVEKYSEELVKYDVEIAPISNGAGTNGKVLSGLSNGLLMIASKCAAENICIRNNDSALIYNQAFEIPNLLLSITNNKEKYQKIAENGRTQILRYHNPTRISKRFMDIISNPNNWR